MHARETTDRSLVTLGKCFTVSLLALALLTMPATANAGGAGKGDTSSALSMSGSGGMSAERRAELMAEIARLDAESAYYSASVDHLDEVIAYVEAFDLLFGQAAGFVTGGDAVYGFSKSITFAVLGEGELAKDAALDGAIGLVTFSFGEIATLEEAAAPTISKAFENIADGTDVANFVFREVPEAATVGGNLGEALVD
jgi:hypothetical protein